MSQKTDSRRVRLDKWLWVARFYKTRGLAAEVIEKGRVQVNGQPAKRSRELHVGDRIALRQGARSEIAREVRVLALCDLRGPAPVAQGLYEETPESIAAREQVAEQRRLAPEPASYLADGRPTKRDRRDIDRARGLGDRWSATAED